ncbi:MAG: hypothetical protein HRT68_12210 [Flavobacteriaceae bacterium]|nr:hypothetical protein [Flavobacteriaceae bacterium]
MASLSSYKSNEYAMIMNEMDIETFKKNGEEVKKKSQDKVREAIKYMTVAYEINPKNIAIVSALKQFYTQIEDMQKSQEFSEKLKQLQN